MNYIELFEQDTMEELQKEINEFLKNCDDNVISVQVFSSSRRNSYNYDMVPTISGMIHLSKLYDHP